MVIHYYSIIKYRIQKNWLWTVDYPFLLFKPLKQNPEKSSTVRTKYLFNNFIGTYYIVTDGKAEQDLRAVMQILRE